MDIKTLNQLESAVNSLISAFHADNSTPGIEFLIINNNKLLKLFITFSQKTEYNPATVNGSHSQYIAYFINEFLNDFIVNQKIHTCRSVSMNYDPDISYQLDITLSKVPESIILRKAVSTRDKMLDFIVSAGPAGVSLSQITRITQGVPKLTRKNILDDLIVSNEIIEFLNISSSKPQTFYKDKKYE